MWIINQLGTYTSMNTPRLVHGLSFSLMQSLFIEPGFRGLSRASIRHGGPWLCHILENNIEKSSVRSQLHILLATNILLAALS